MHKVVHFLNLVHPIFAESLGELRVDGEAEVFGALHRGCAHGAIANDPPQFELLPQQIETSYGMRTVQPVSTWSKCVIG